MQSIGPWSKQWRIKFENDLYHCDSYLKESLMLLFVPLILMIISSGSKKLLRLFSTWERRHSIPEQKVAAINSMALLNIINIGFVMFLINVKLIPIPGFLEGEMSATPEFFTKIGDKIVITMFIMLFSIHGSNLAYAGCCDLKRKYDRDFGPDDSRTKTLTQIDY
jgi:hypothetical protein